VSGLRDIKGVGFGLHAEYNSKAGRLGDPFRQVTGE
jgi:hypothetical protein